MKNFNSTEFNTLVKNYKETMKHITSDSQVKCQICQIAKDNGYDSADVLNYIYNLWVETYPDFTSGLSSKKWNTIYKNSIKEAIAEYDWETVRLLKEALESVHSKGEEREEELRTKFFAIIEGMGLDPILMVKDMSIDLWGWIKTIDLIVFLAEEGYIGETEDTVLSTDEPVAIETVVTDKVLSAFEFEKDTDSTEETEVKEDSTPEVKEEVDDIPKEEKTIKRRKRTNYLEIQQYSLEGELIGRFKNIAEAARSGSFNHASISKCLCGIYNTAEGFKWVGVKKSASESDKVAA